jgi:ribosome maturation factor RimP
MPTFFFIVIFLMYREALVRNITDIIEPLLQAQGFEIVELQLRQRKGSWLVRVFVDAEGGISVDDCRTLSFEIGQALDAEDLIPESYVLEVSSPGLDRPLRTPRDFRRQYHHMVTVFLRIPLLGKTQYTGRVAVVDDAHLVLHLPPDTPFEIPLTHIDHGIVELEFK